MNESPASSLLERSARALRVLAAVSLAIMMIVTVLDISMRLTLNRLILGSVEIVSLTLVAVVFLAIPETFLRQEQITVDAIDLFVRPRTRRVLHLLATLLTVLMLAVMFVFMLPVAIDTLGIGDATTDLGFSLFWYWLPILVGIAAAVLAACSVLAHAWRDPGSGEDEIGDGDGGGAI